MREDFYNFIKSYIEENYDIKEIKNAYELSDIIGEANNALIDNVVDIIINETSHQVEEEYEKELKF